MQRSRVNAVLDEGAMLLLNKTLLGLSLIDTGVHRDPCLIRAKETNTTLPIEVWDMIIVHATAHSDSDEYILVRPRALQREQEGGNDEGVEP